MGLIKFEEMTEEQKHLLKKIHKIARQMEQMNNTGKAHARIAMIEELTKEPTSESYIREKMKLLFY